MVMLWTPIFAFAVFALFFGIGDFIASKTKGIISSVVVGSMIFVVLFSSDIFPKDALASTGIISLMASIGLFLMVVGVGTEIDLKGLLEEWRTVVIALAGMAGIAVSVFTIETLIIGREYALISAAPISGGLLATIIASNAANEVGRTDLATFASLVMSFQILVGMPLASFCLKKESSRLLKSINSDSFGFLLVGLIALLPSNFSNIT